ncbi:MAG: hypothetical protein WCD86_15760 [Ktedonobacteraceae bacterium]
MEQESDPANERDRLLSGIMQQFGAFLTQAETRWQYRVWLETAAMRVYVRKTRRLLAGIVRNSLDIAAIEIAEEQQGKGLFSAFMTNVHTLNPYEVTYLEHAHNPLIETWCVRHGWVADPGTSPVSFYALKTTGETVQAASSDAIPPSDSPSQESRVFL